MSDGFFFFAVYYKSMSDVLHANIFFFITAVSVVVVSGFVVVLLYYCVGIARDVRAIAAKVRKASDELEQDFEALRAQVKTEGVKVRGIIDLLIGFVTYRFGTRSRKKKSEEKAVSE
jgi:hypothetical protein